MDSRLLAVILGITTLVSVAAVAPLYSRLSQDRDDVDHITLYQNGLAAISLVRAFASPGGEQVLAFQLPTTAMFETLAVAGEGVSVLELRSSLAARPLLQPGDGLVVHLDDKTTLTGTLVARQDGSLLLATEGGTTLAQESHVTAVEVTGRRVDPRTTGAVDVTVKVSAPSGAHSVRLSYLAEGSGWEPHYHLDAQSGAMTFFASLTGLQDWSNVTLDLVSGNPNRVYTWSPTRVAYAGLSLDSAAGGSGTGTYSPAVEASQPLGDLHRYHYPGTVSFARGEAVRLPVATGHADIVRHYYTTTLGAYPTEWQGLAETYQVRNALTEPLPAGRVDVSLGPEWIGSDNLPDLGRGEQANVTVAHSGEVKARVQVGSDVAGEPTPNDQFGHRTRLHTTGYDVQVRNLKGAAVDTRVAFQADGYRTVVTQLDPAPSEQHGDLKVWDRTVSAGQTLTFRVTLERTEDA
ncbi:MAG: DUF4139 domain-containing protein [Halobacteriales archaeon]|nr:DUF4139 domain-containing protein [Halobacteriales archaeon]